MNSANLKETETSGRRVLLFDASPLCCCGDDAGRGGGGIARVCLNQLLGLLRIGEFDICLVADEKYQRYFEALKLNVPELSDCRTLFYNMPLRHRLLRLPAVFVRKLVAHTVPFLWNGFLDKLLRLTVRLWCRPLPAPDWDVFGSGEAVVYYSCYYGMPPQLLRVPNLRRFAMIHDLIPMAAPQLSSLCIFEFAFNVYRNAFYSDGLFFASEFSRSDYVRFFGNHPDGTVLYSAAGEEFRPLPEDETDSALVRLGLPRRGRYALSVATLDKRKNLIRTMRCFIEMVERNGAEDFYLVLAGGRLDNVDYLYSEAGKYRDRIILTGFVDEADLAALYNGALFYVFLSEYEGFGLPVLEAMRCGIPVLSSSAASLPEVAGDAALFVPPDDEKAVSEAMSRLWCDAALRDDLRRRGFARAAEFSWEKHCRCLADELKRLS